MPVIVIGGIKGGSGKTTIASNLAVIRSKSKNVLLIDADEQRSVSDWVEHRESLGIKTKWKTISLLGSHLRAQLLKLIPNYDDIIIDTGGRDTTSQRAALTIADIFLVPFQPRSLDVWTIGKVISLISEIRSVNSKLKVYSVLNRADSQGIDNYEAGQILQENQEMTFIPYIIGQRKAFSNASAEGLGVVELKKKDLKAINEILSIANCILN